jgi:hypothetical protein
MEEEINAFIESEKDYYDPQDLAQLKSLLFSIWDLYLVKYKTNLSLGIQKFKEKNLSPMSKHSPPLEPS